MKRLAAFLTRLLVFSMLAVVQRLIFDASPDPLRESFNRMVVGSCQVLIIFSVYLLVQICRWIFNVINAQGTYNNVSTNNLECDEILRYGEARSMHAETASVLSTGLIANKVIIFANRDALSQHVMRVYFTGFLLWCTSSYCFSYMESQVLLWVSVGFFIGYACLHVNKTMHKIDLFYEMSVLALIITTFVSFPLWYMQPWKTYIVSILTPFLVGFFWMSGCLHAWKHDHLLETTVEALPVLLMALFPALILATAPSTDHLERLFYSMDIKLLFYVFALEPIFKFFSIYIMIVSLQSKKKLDLLLTFNVVVQSQTLNMSDFSGAFGADSVRIWLVLILLVLRVIQCLYVDCNDFHQRRQHSNTTSPFADEQLSVRSAMIAKWQNSQGTVDPLPSEMHARGPCVDDTDAVSLQSMASTDSTNCKA